MINKMYSIYDKKTIVYRPPFYAINDEHAKRMLMIQLPQSQSEVNLYPEDFCLMSIGNFNDNDGTIKSHQPKTVCEITALVKKDKTSDNREEQSEDLSE